MPTASPLSGEAVAPVGRGTWTSRTSEESRSAAALAAVVAEAAGVATPAEGKVRVVVKRLNVTKFDLATRVGGDAGREATGHGRVVDRATRMVVELDADAGVRRADAAAATTNTGRIDLAVTDRDPGPVQ